MKMEMICRPDSIDKIRIWHKTWHIEALPQHFLNVGIRRIQFQCIQEHLECFLVLLWTENWADDWYQADVKGNMWLAHCNIFSDL